MFKLNLPTLLLWNNTQGPRHSLTRLFAQEAAHLGKCMNLRIRKIRGIPARYPSPHNSSSCIGAMGNCLHSLGSKQEATYQSLCEDGAPHSGAGPSA